MSLRHPGPASQAGGGFNGWLREKVQRGAVPLLEPAAWLLAGWYTAAAVVQAWGPWPETPTVVAASAISAFLLAAAAAFAHRAEDDGVRASLAAGMGVVIAAHAVFRMSTSSGLEGATYLGLVLVGLGAFMKGRVFLPIAGLAGVSWLLVLARDGATDRQGHFTIYLAASGLLGWVLLLLRRYCEEELNAARRVEEGLNADLRINLGWYRKLFSESPALMCVHDSEGRVEEVNPAGLKALGYAREDVVGRNIMEFMLPVTEDGPEKYLRDIQRYGWTEGLLRARRSDGSLRIWEYRSTILENGDERQVLATAADVTELAEARDWVPNEVEDREE